MICKIDHIGVAVASLESALAFWADSLGLQVEGMESVESEQVKTAFLKVGESRIELLEPQGEGGAVGRFLDKRGGGVHHITFSVTDLDAALAHLRQREVRLVGEAPRVGAGGHRVAFLHPASCGGVLVELVERPAPPRSKSVAAPLAPGAAVLLYLRDPQEKQWGVLRSLDANGVVIEGVDLASFEDWIAQIERNEASIVGPSVVFVPTSRMEKILLDRSSGDLPSLAERFERRTGKTVQQVLDEAE
jgi:methylmalonyl-CoA/ethylmalonyl-CoA epimerase